MTVAVLSNHRRIAPFGLEGGSAGATGVNRIERAGGAVERLPACASASVKPGDAIVIETPGGGGFG
jgi:5-oxoprolinase (ATP-hydrolysing)